MKNRSSLTLFTTMLSVVACFGLLPQVRAGLPLEIPGNPDGCYPAFNTAEGCNALFNVTGGIGDTGLGWYSLFIVGNGGFNTGVGAGALALTSPLVWASASKAERSALASIRSRRPLRRPAISPVSSVMALSLA